MDNLKLEYTEPIKVYLKTGENDLVEKATFEETDFLYMESLEEVDLTEIEDFLGVANKDIYIKNGSLVKEPPKNVTVDLLRKEIEKRNETILETQLAMAELAEMVTQLF